MTLKHHQYYESAKQRLSEDNLIEAERLLDQAIASTETGDIKARSKYLAIIGIVYMALGNLRKALMAFHEELKCSPNDADVIFKIALLLERMGWPSKARTFFAAARSAGSRGALALPMTPTHIRAFLMLLDPNELDAMSSRAEAINSSRDMPMEAWVSFGSGQKLFCQMFSESTPT